MREKNHCNNIRFVSFFNLSFESESLSNGLKFRFQRKENEICMQISPFMKGIELAFIFATVCVCVYVLANKTDSKSSTALLFIENTHRNESVNLKSSSITAFTHPENVKSNANKNGCAIHEMRILIDLNYQ